MPRKKKSPKLKVGPITIRAVRGPKGPGVYYWQARWTYEGKRVTQAFGWMSADEALQEAARIIAEGCLPPPDDDDVRTVSDLLEKWKEKQAERKLAPNTLANYRRGVTRMTASMGDVDLKLIDSHTLEDYRDNSGYSPGVILNDLTNLRSAWEWARQKNLTPNRTLPRIKLDKRDVVEHYRPTNREAAAVVTWLWNNAPVGIALGIQVLAYTGCRLSEAARIEMDDIDLVRRGVHLGRHEGGTKTGHRWFPLPEELIGLIEQHGAKEGPITGYRPNTFHSAVQAPRYRKKGEKHVATKPSWLAQACTALRIQRFTTKGFRRLKCDQLYSSGIDPTCAARLLGHSATTALKYYRRPSELQLRQAAETAWAQQDGQVLRAPFGD